MIQLDLQNRQPIYEQLISKLNELISMEILSPDDQLPSVRSLARDLGVNPNTCLLYTSMPFSRAL